MGPTLENIFRILAHKLKYFSLGTVKKMNQSMNQLGVEGHRKCGMYKSLLGDFSPCAIMSHATHHCSFNGPSQFGLGEEGHCKHGMYSG